MGGRLQIGKNFVLEWGKDQETRSLPNAKEITEEIQAVKSTAPSPYGRAPLSTDTELAADVKQVFDIVMPVGAGRQTVPDTVSIMDLFQKWSLINPQFNPELIQVIEHLGMWHPDVSKALENYSLARTTRTLYFDKKVGKPLQADAITHLNRQRKKWYRGSYGESGMVNAMIRQVGIAGCTSFEMIPNIDISGLNEVVFPTPANIMFLQKPGGGWIPCQKVPGNSIYNYRNAKLIDGVYLPLNDFLYKYTPLNRNGDYPYGIPPFLSALESIVIQKDMIENLKTVINRLGLLGFLKVLLNKPVQKPGESGDAYRERINQEVDFNAGMIKKGFKSGYMIGFKDLAEIDMQGVTQNVDGADKLVDINDKYVMTGLKQDLSLMNRPNSTTETFARVILSVMTKNLTNIQELVASGMDQMDLMELSMVPQFRKIDYLESEFEPVLLGDEVKKEQAYTAKIANAKTLWSDGVIDKVTYANIAGYDEPDNDNPPTPAPGTPDPNADGGGDPGADGGKADPKGKKPAEGDQTEANAAMVTYLQQQGLGDSPEFDYCQEHYAHHNHSTTVSMSADTEEEWYAEYNAAISKHFRHAVAMSARKARNRVGAMSGSSSLAEVQNAVLFALYTTWGEEYVNKVKPDIDKYVRESYRFFRQSKKPFVGRRELGGVPEATFNLTDLRVQEFFKKSDHLYLGKFIYGEDTKQRLNEWIRQEYIDGDRATGRGEASLDGFEQGLQEQLGLEIWKQRRIVDTTVTRLRSIGSIKYMEQAGIVGYEIVSLTDRLSCDYCKGMDGKVFGIHEESARIDRLMSEPPESTPEISPFITSLYKSSDLAEGQSMENFISEKPASEIQSAGAALAPFHPHCRCRNVAAEL